MKDEELHHLSNDLRTCDCTIKDLMDKLTDTAEAAEGVATAVHVMDEERRFACEEIEKLSTYTVKQLNTLMNKVQIYFKTLFITYFQDLTLIYLA